MGFQDPEVPVTEDLSVALLRLDKSSSRPPERHLPVLPVRHPSGLLPGSGVSAVDEICRAQTPPERGRQPQAVDGEHL